MGSSAAYTVSIPITADIPVITGAPAIMTGGAAEVIGIAGDGAEDMADTGMAMAGDAAVMVTVMAGEDAATATAMTGLIAAGVTEIPTAWM